MTRDETPDELPDETAAPGRQRIAKLMARVGLCSRRDAEAWIVDGRVSVNGEVLTSPALDVGPDDTIVVDGAPLPQAQKTRLFLFHKPRGLVTSDRDPEGRATVADYLREHWPDGPRVVTIGRLDINTEGLLLLTNDGGLARLLELPKTGWVRRYRVRAKGETDQAVLDRLADGITIEGIDYAGIEAKLDRQQGANVWLTMGLREGKNREVKRVLESLGLEVNRLIRLSFGPFQLGDLPEGAVEEVRTRVLRDQLGPSLAAAAAVAFEDAPAPVEHKPVRADRKPARTAGAEQTNKMVRPPKESRNGRGPREERPRGGERSLRRSPNSETPAPAPKRERPTAGARKHVSTLRAEEAEATKRGPRRRIERADLTDRRDRKVVVERRVGANAIEPTRARSAARPRRDEAGGAPGRSPHRPVSPSALAKRARVASSGGRPGDEREERQERGRREERGPPRGRERPAEGRREQPARAAGDAPRQGRPDGTQRRGASGSREERGTSFEDKRPRRASPRDASDGNRRPSRSGASGAERSTRPSPPVGERLKRGERPARGERPKGDESQDQRRDGTKFGGKRPVSARAARGGERGERRDGPERTGQRAGAARPEGNERRGPPRRAPAGASGRPGGKAPSRPDGGPGRGKPRGPSGGGRGKPRPRG